MSPHTRSIAFLLGRPLRQIATIALVLVVAIGITGCPGSGPANSVQGTVTLNGKPVNGELFFITSDGKQIQAPLLDGKYFINDPPLGQVKITIKSMPGFTGASGTKGQLDKGAGTDLSAKATVSEAVSPPEKYSRPDNGLTYEVKAGKQTHDITLTP
jgi:hypothetical protein